VICRLIALSQINVGMGCPVLQIAFHKAREKILHDALQINP
jgi:hypothetical protein